MMDQSSYFETFSNLRNKYFVEPEIESESSQTSTNEQNSNHSLKMNKSSRTIFHKTALSPVKESFQNKMKSSNASKRWEMEELFRDQSQGNLGQYGGSNIEKVIKIPGGKTTNGKQCKQNGKNGFQNTADCFAKANASQKHIIEKDKTEDKKSLSEKLTEAFTPFPNCEIGQEPEGKDTQRRKQKKQCNFIRVKCNNKKSATFNEPDIKDFKLIKKIGRGVQGQVQLALHLQTGMIFALKVVYKQYLKQNQKHEENLLREIKIHLHLNDKNIVKLFTVFSDANNVYMVLEPMIDGDLWGIKRKYHRLSEKNASKIVFHICKAVKSLHSKDIIHRDIKLQNVLLTEGIAKLADFGCAVHSVCMRKSAIGSPAYLSPQQIGNRFYNNKIDIWSIGIITYELLYGVSPFEKQIQNSLFRQEETPHFNLVFPAQIKVSEYAQDFMKMTLQKNSNSRIDIQTALKHPFLLKKRTLESPI